MMTSNAPSAPNDYDDDDDHDGVADLPRYTEMLLHFIRRLMDFMNLELIELDFIL